MAPNDINTATTRLQKGEEVEGLVYFYGPDFSIGRITGYGMPRADALNYVVVEFVSGAWEVDGSAINALTPGMEGEWVVLLPSLIAGRTYDEAMHQRNTLGRE